MQIQHLLVNSHLHYNQIIIIQIFIVINMCRIREALAFHVLQYYLNKYYLNDLDFYLTLIALNMSNKQNTIFCNIHNFSRLLQILLSMQNIYLEVKILKNKHLALLINNHIQIIKFFFNTCNSHIINRLVNKISFLV